MNISMIGGTKITLGWIFILAMAIALILGNGHSSALSGSEFKAGRIIDDTVFYDGTTMSPTEIQNFLNAKLPTCDTNGTQSTSYYYTSATGEVNNDNNTWDGDQWITTSRATYGKRVDDRKIALGKESVGSLAPYICLKDHRQDTGYKAGQSGLCSAIEAKTNRTAAQIIDDVARACHISQKVIVVMLQKEQGLVTDDWPWGIQYRGAMGYGCPDTAACSSEYYGFFNQVYNAALQFQRYKAAPNNWNHVPFMTNNVLYQANTPSCGSRSTYIENYATAGLYNYTPYTPNQAALDNLYGTGDGCSAYGNRNFWRYYNDWFGTTFSPSLAWQIQNLTIYDENKNIIMPTDYLRVGERVKVSLKVKNIGNVTWKKDGSTPIRLGTDTLRDAPGRFCDDTWLNCNRAASIFEQEISPGNEGHFEFYLNAPNTPGEYREYYTPLLENMGWMSNHTNFHIYLKTKPDYAWEWGSLEAWTDSSKTQPVDLTNLAKSQEVYVTVFAKNKSATTWTNGGTSPVRLGTANPVDRSSQLCTGSWLSCRRAAPMNEATVAPGQIASFSFTVKAPATAGEHREYLKPVLEMRGWSADTYHHIYMRVR